MKIILDVQGFNIENNKYIIKELAAFNGTMYCHYIFKPPFSLNNLPSKFHKEVTWLMYNHHCIDWNEGFTPLHKFAEIIKNLTSKVKYVYVKGSEKAGLIRKYSSAEVIEIDQQPALKPQDPSCFYHIRAPCFCALSNVFYLYNNIFM